MTSKRLLHCCVAGLVFFLGGCATEAWAQSAKHAFTASDWVALHSASPVAISPDGATILCHVGWGADKGTGNQEWRLIGADGGNPRKLDFPEHFTPYGFMPGAGSIYGGFEINKLTQLAVFEIAGLKSSSTPSVAVMLPSGIQSATLSPDGKRFAIVASSRPPDDLSEVRTVIEPEQTGVYVVNADGTGGRWWSAGLRPTGENTVAGPTNDIAAIAWSSDGGSLAVLSQTPKIGFHYVRSFIDIVTTDAVRHVAEVPNAAVGLAWGDEGRELVFLNTTNSVLTADHVWTVAASGGTPVDRTPKLDASAVGIASDPHGKVWVQMNRGVKSEIDSFQGGGLTPAFSWPDGSIGGLPVFSQLASGSGQIALTVDDPMHVPNVAVPQGGGGLRGITTEGDDQIAKTDLGPVRVVHWTSKEGIHLEGIATFPAGYVAGRRYPFLVLPHGGPEANDSLGFDPFPKIIAGLGYVVLQPEYRGSTGYGDEFLDAIYQHFGDRAYRDVDSATDYAIEQGWADPGRLAIFGWSAGGFMTSWTVTQTGRYRAAIEGAGITDWASFIWTSDVQQIDYDARWPEKDINAFLQFSAVSRASQVTTPILILHGEADVRVPTFQGREFYEALLANGKVTKMVTYPGSPHFPRLWEQRQDIFNEVAAWLARYNS
ncbi:MAG TPA: S9 family peptidase [Blastocatellia bacterium]